MRTFNRANQAGRKDVMRNLRLRVVPGSVAMALLLGAFLSGGTVRAQGALVKVTPLGSHAGELCAQDRAFLFEDPTGVRILYDPGFTTDETDPRLGDVHVILLSHPHPDHIGIAKANRGGATCAAPARGPANTSSNVATTAALKNAAVITAAEVTAFLGSKIQGLRGVATPACATSGLEHETVVPLSSPCTAVLGIGGRRTIRRAGASAAVRITGVQAVHNTMIPEVLVDAPGLPPGMTGYGGVAMGFVLQFTNGLTAYLTGDTGMFGDMGSIIANFYNPNLVVMNIGPGGQGPNSIGVDEAVAIMQNMLRPRTVMPSHVSEQATSGGAVRANTWTERFARFASPFAEVVVPLSDVTLAFDGDGRCIGCPR